MDQCGGNGIRRREFLRSGATGAGAALTLTSCGSPERTLVPALIPEDRILPGADRWVTTTCSLCPAGCGIRVRTMHGEARVLRDGREFRQEMLQVKKIEGNPESRLGRGGVCVRGQAAPALLYHPDRFRAPVKLEGPRGAGNYVEISWDEAFAVLEQRLSSLRGGGSMPGLGALLGAVPSIRRELAAAFVRAAGSDWVFVTDIPGSATLREANRLTYGRRVLEVQDLENTECLISFGAPVLEAHVSPVLHARGLSAMRRGNGRPRGRVIQVESRFSLTAANADEWLPARPGTEGCVALAIAGEILDKGLVDTGALAARVKGLDPFRAAVTARFSPDRVAAVSGVATDVIRRIARDFAARRPAVAMAGGSAVAHPDGLRAAGAAQALNVIVGSVGATGGIALPRGEGGVDAERGTAWAAAFIAAAPSIDVLLMLNADPLALAPSSAGLEGALGRIPFIVSFATIPDDSSAWADLILPDPSFLERWNLQFPEPSYPAVATLSQPTVRPVYGSRDAGDVLLELARRSRGGPAKALPFDSMEGYARSRFEQFMRPPPDENGEAWESLKKAGFAVLPDPPPDLPDADLSWLCDAGLANREQMPDFPMYFQAVPTGALGFGEAAGLPWLQEVPDPMTSIVWGGWLEINSGTAAALGIRDGDVVRVESRTGAIEVPAYLTPAARPDTVSMPFGRGRRWNGRYASGRGADPWRVIENATVLGVGEAAWAATSVRISKTGARSPVAKFGTDRGPAPAGLFA